MTTIVDTNVIAALWDSREAFNSAARTALDEALHRGSLIVPAPVFAELLAFPGRTEAFLNTFFRERGSPSIGASPKISGAPQVALLILTQRAAGGIVEDHLGGF